MSDKTTINNKIRKLKKEQHEIEHAVEMLTFDYEQDFSDAVEAKEIRLTEIGIEIEILNKKENAAQISCILAFH